jgi:uncharacterized protein YraI
MSQPATSLRSLSTTSRLMSRSSTPRAIVSTGLTIGASTPFGQVLAEHASQLHTVSTNSNLRSGPGTAYAVITVIPSGSAFTLTAQEQNSFYGVNYNGKTGWVYAPLIVASGASSGEPVMVGEARTTTEVNLRSGPGTGHSVLGIVESGSGINVSNTVQDGFRYVVHQGLAGWMDDQFIIWDSDPAPVGESFTTSANLNLRAEPNTSARILLVMPSGSTVTGLEGGPGGFRKVSYQGTVGWAATAYLN